MSQSSNVSLAKPALPATQQQAQDEMPYWQSTLTLAQIRYDCARRQLLQARDDLTIVEKIADGEFEPDAPVADTNYYGVRPVREHCVGSRGPWSWAL